jgi:hypothetical protein
MTAPSQCLLALDSSGLIALLAALFSALAALYARWAAVQAERANELALLAHRKAIYDAFYELRMHMQERRFRPDIAQVSKFYYPSKDAAFYVKESLSNEISEYYDLCFKVADLARVENLNPNESDEVKASFSQAQDLAKKIDGNLKALVKKYAANG